MVAAAVIGGVATVAGAAMASDSARRTSNTAADASRDANGVQKYMYDQTRADETPYRDAGYDALGSMRALLKNPASITNDPGYQFAFDQGTRAINSQAAAHGNYYSGNTLKALTRYGQGAASQQFDNIFNRYASVAGLGQVANSANQRAGLAYADAYGNNLMGAASARGAASIARGNAWQNALNQGAYQGVNWLNRPANGGGRVTNGNLLTANYSDDPIGSLGTSQGWWEGP